METLIELLKNYDMPTLMIIFIMFLLAIFGIYEAAKKIQSIFNNYYNIRAGNQEKEDKLNERISNLEESEKEDKRQFAEIKTEVASIRKLIEKMQEDSENATTAQKKANRAQSRSAMMRLSNELINKGYMTETESETLQDLVTVFMQSATKDDSYAIPATVNRAMHLNIYTVEEVEKMKSGNPSKNNTKEEDLKNEQRDKN